MEEFITTFNQFVDFVGKAMPPEANGVYTKMYWGMSMMSRKGVHKFFMDTTEKYQTDILSKDETFIDDIKTEFEILQHYHKMDKEARKACLEYMKVLYLMAYRVKNIPNKK